jgi:crossover junction endodeoxyribonuclease RuvC
VIILGIDPGLQVSGFAVLRKEGGSVVLLEYGHLSMSCKRSLSERVFLFHQFIDQKIVQWRVTDLALESPFLGKNTQSFLKLGYLRGIVYLLVHTHQIALQEFSPREVKLAVTGFGGSDKDVVARMVLKFFPQIKQPLARQDVSDAIAVSLCSLWKKGNRL